MAGRRPGRCRRARRRHLRIRASLDTCVSLPRRHSSDLLAKKNVGFSDPMHDAIASESEPCSNGLTFLFLNELDIHTGSPI